MILAVGEALMEFRRSTADGVLVTPGRWDGPFASGAPANFASVAARLGAPAALGAAVGADRFGDALVERLARDGVRTAAIALLPRRATATAFLAYADSGDRDFCYSVHDSAAMGVDPDTCSQSASRATRSTAARSTPIAAESCTEYQKSRSLLSA